MLVFSVHVLGVMFQIYSSTVIIAVTKRPQWQMAYQRVASISGVRLPATIIFFPIVVVEILRPFAEQYKNILYSVSITTGYANTPYITH